jgi:FlaA1/EpsC-like NDP-sugar epimerase
MTADTTQRLLKYRRPFIVLLQLVVVVLSHYWALWLRFDGAIPPVQATWMVDMLPWLVAIRGLSFIPFRVYEGLWRYTSVWDLRNIIASVLTSTVAFYVVVRWGFGATAYPRSVAIIDSVLLVVLLGGLRLGRRVYGSFSGWNRDKRVLIYGAGHEGEMIVRGMYHSDSREYQAVGFVDDDRAKIGQRIHGVKVLGTRDDLPQIMKDVKPNVVVVAVARSEPTTFREILRILEPFKVPIQRLPNISDVLDGRVTVGQLRTLSIEDLLERVPIGLDREPVRNMIEGKRVLVTGAGGSIGSELCRQIATLAPAELVAVERYENGLYTTMNDLAARTPDCEVRGVIADVTDAQRMRRLFGTYRPEIVFHAAAHKHVPLMESNPCEAVLNNVRGARVLVETTQEAGVERVILVSSDKAVNPTSIMGATKRVAELLFQSASVTGSGTFAAVRFGNVLGSSGSVVPLFLEQIKAGKPVTVTHAEMRRYFMLIDEAVGLLLHAATLAKGGDIYVLEMGKQVSVLGLARNLIQLAGLVPNDDIPIVFTGIRPGEKLFEEFVGADEEIEPSSTDGILRIRSERMRELAELKQPIADIEHAAQAGDEYAVRAKLREIVPTCHYSEPS